MTEGGAIPPIAPTLKLNTMEIKITWSTYDVFVKAQEMGIEITETQANLILLKMERYHDASIGINWDVISSYLLDLNN